MPALPRELKTLFLNLYTPPLDGEPLNDDHEDACSVADSGYAEPELDFASYKHANTITINPFPWRDILSHHFNDYNTRKTSKQSAFPLQNISPFDTEEVIQELIWRAIQPLDSEDLETRKKTFKRVAALVLTGTEAFIQRFVDYLLGLFWQAWFVEARHPLFHDLRLRQYHLHLSINLAGLLASFYVHGSDYLQHTHFQTCVCVVMDQVFFYESVQALRLMIDVIGRSKSRFWGSGIEAERTKHEFAHTFRDNVTSARLPLGREWGVYQDGMTCLGKERFVRARVVNKEIRDMFLRLGVGDAAW
ncbi:hypothetical protein VNI00_002788 [Paramarasmius palmivorus]|uniref:Uncharacterized protein n=1 Tax=Paramarasmius palmivorus TaxID=297713 RepID=A0AAW0DVB6_9AGAR